MHPPTIVLRARARGPESVFPEALRFVRLVFSPRSRVSTDVPGEMSKSLVDGSAADGSVDGVSINSDNTACTPFPGAALLLGESSNSLRRKIDWAGFAEVGGRKIPNSKTVASCRLEDLSPSLDSGQHLDSEAATAVTVALVS